MLQQYIRYLGIFLYVNNTYAVSYGLDEKLKVITRYHLFLTIYWIPTQLKLTMAFSPNSSNYIVVSFPTRQKYYQKTLIFFFFSCLLTLKSSNIGQGRVGQGRLNLNLMENIQKELELYPISKFLSLIQNFFE